MTNPFVAGLLSASCGAPSCASNYGRMSGTARHNHTYFRCGPSRCELRCAELRAQLQRISSRAE
eukprot:10984393-Alexandrium_andersonii.AAC.1